MKHDSPCFRKTSYSSTAAEEHECTDISRQLLFDDSGKPRGEDTAVFVSHLVADNDTRGPNNFMRTQTEIMGPVAGGKAQHVPDVRHSIKGNNNETYKLRDKERSFCRKTALVNVRIKSIKPMYLQP